jgi:DNA/RNA-binding domain of Phe-tRNA-synthetase-like protein
VSDPVEGWIAPDVAEEWPALKLWCLELPGGQARSPDGVRDRLRVLSDRFRGPQAVAMRQQPIPWAYRVFFRHIGLDPDVDRTPVEALALDRLIQGGFPSHGLVTDALTIAVMETGVGVWALDAGCLDGPLGIRTAVARERLGRTEEEIPPPLVPAGRLVVADSTGPVAVLFGELAASHSVTRESTRVALFSVQVAGVPEIHVEEAFWTVADIVAGERG